ncbi:MAG: helix-turn-helix domain-containing protein [Reyranellaceae bacterium]
MMDDFGTLAAIERRRAAIMGPARALPLPTSAGEIRRLESAANMLREEVEKLRRQVTRLQRENEALRTAGPRWRVPKVTTADILRVAAIVTGFGAGEMKGPSRAPELVNARHFAMYLVHVARRDLSQPKIGELFGGRDHTTVGATLTKVRKRLGAEPFRSWLDDGRVRDLLEQTAAGEALSERAVAFMAAEG